jgi:mono/diheme cytochrome c family protein
LRRARALLLGWALLLLAWGCSVEDWRRAPGPDDVIRLVPWFTGMYDHVAIPPLKSYCAEDRPTCRQPVDGTVPVTGADPVLPPAQLAPTAANIRELGRRFPNPVPNTAESLERGRDRFEIFCALCHGMEGAGDGQIDSVMSGIIPSLVSEQVRGYTDGYIYSVIVNGRGALMSRYRQRVRGDDRWHIVNYIRLLQGTAQ